MYVCFFCVNNHYADDIIIYLWAFLNSVGLISLALDFRLFITFGQRAVFFLKAKMILFTNYRMHVGHKTPELKLGIFPSAHRWFLYLLVFLCFTAFLRHIHLNENSTVKWIFMHHSVVSIKLYISNHLNWWLCPFHRWLTVCIFCY